MRGWILLCCALLPLAACRQRSAEASAEAAIERTAGEEAETEGDLRKFTVKTRRGEMTLRSGGDMALPEGFPEDLYLPEGYRVRQVIDMASATVVTVTVADAPANLIAEAGSAMQGRGWKQTLSSANAKGTGLLIFEKERRRAAMTFGTYGATGERVIQVQLTAKR